jgi:hypothetical protein
MTVRRLCVVVMLTLLAAPAAAQSPAGKWKTGVDSPKGRLPLIFEFVVKGDKMTGSVSNDFMPKFPIENGAVKGSELSFTLKLQAVTLGYTGRLKGNELTLTSKVLEEKPSAAASGESLGDVLRHAGVLTATRDK